MNLLEQLFFVFEDVFGLFGLVGLVIGHFGLLSGFLKLLI